MSPFFLYLWPHKMCRNISHSVQVKVLISHFPSSVSCNNFSNILDKKKCNHRYKPRNMAQFIYTKMQILLVLQTDREVKLLLKLLSGTEWIQLFHQSRFAHTRQELLAAWADPLISAGSANSLCTGECWRLPTCSAYPWIHRSSFTHQGVRTRMSLKGGRNRNA